MSSPVPPCDFQTIFDALPGIYLILAPDFTMVAANDARLKATMTTRQDTLGRKLFDIFPDNPGDPQATGVANLRASLQRVLETRQPDTMAVQKYDIPRPDGAGFEERYWSPMNCPVLDANGEVAYIVHRVEDVTEFVRLRQQGAEQSRLAERLQAQVERTEMEVYLRAQELQAANQKLRELDRLKSEFFANVSHELRTPLTLILAPLEAMLASGAPADPESLQRVHGNAVRLLQMINGLLDFSKVSAGKVEVSREPVDIVELTRSITWDFRPLADQKGQRLEFTSRVSAPRVEMDRYLFEKIVFNLLSNAVKFTPPGGSIELTLEVRDAALALKVADNGIGIAPADQQQLFQKFHQVEATSTRRFEGTGLGLSLVKEFAQLLGGGIAVESEPGKGSTFTFTCPATEVREASDSASLADAGDNRRPRAVPLQPKLAPQPASAGREDLPRLLVAEDNPELSAFLASLLNGFCQVRLAADGGEALELARSWRPDLVISDVMMPRLDGIELTRELKQDPGTSGIPVVLLTAMTDRAALMNGWEAGADDYLFKPFHPRELEARVRTLLNGLQWRRKGEAYRKQRDALEHFNHIASHDLREPLRKIVTFTGLLGEAGASLGAEPARYLESIGRAAGRMTRLLDSLMVYCRLNSKGEQLRPRSLEAIVREVLADFAPEMEAARAEVSIGTLPVLAVHPELIAVVFANLLGNSLKYRAQDRPLQLVIRAERKGPEWQLSFQDNGRGFEARQSERIFIMFERLHTESEIPGEGMGLAICRKIVENHGGRIWADSAPGKGTTFHFSLPAERVEAGGTG